MPIARMTRLFFDAPKVVRSVDAATRRVLGKAGAFVRRTARSSIRKRKRISPPGQPPSSHTGLLKKFIFFGYDRRRRSVVIGPARLARTAGIAPRALEHGGRSVTTTRGRRGKRKRTVPTRVRARPYMGPALNKELPRIPDLWRNSVRR